MYGQAPFSGVTMEERVRNTADPPPPSPTESQAGSDVAAPSERAERPNNTVLFAPA